MNIEHLVLIRFSVEFNNRPEFNKRLPELFDKERLELRMKLFKEFCLWSLINQTLINFKAIIIYDPKLPKEYLDQLIKLTKDYKYIILHKWDIKDNVSTNKWLQPYIDKSKDLLITSRFDDDDIIRIDLNELMYGFIRRKIKYVKNSIISFKKGKFIYIDKDKYSISPCCYKHNIGIWLSHITDINSDINIYNFDHSRIESIRIFNLGDNFSWGCVNHSWGNDNRIIRMKHKYAKRNKINQIKLHEIYDFFS